ncbi:hypothetical protein MINTM008_09730 [Mycobacterium intracellulare]|jgi:hypothetical protein|uniref:Metal-dependent hydrolase n=7 Tax=Mycobacteriaceae TaxID=1762 RepID=A0A557XL00_9MYCO|nr:metal-dependent hydrolase [Mycobacterium avium subsp. hominissuis]PJE02311.1 MAG: hypothetical protein CK429_34785 [Mycobacterium sp.]QGK47334.1 hypothetical protein GJE02_05315 [Mycobacterium intracellulare subsp. chimaera]TVS84085.1 metal-dependent hydrolase [Mycobacterium helveticum]BBZ47590.1 hypothetical protein MPRM_48710 [Mycobacterium parmense]BCO45044.1 hypothetical protein MINTM002_07180 [Mycobacterium intracellulare]GFG66561.1 hypothetical protein MKUB_40510 [Mycobacterium kubic
MVASQAMAAKSGTAAEKVAESTYPKARRIRFWFGDPEPMDHHFVEGNIVFSHLVALLSGVFPPGEELFIRSVRRFADQMTDPVLMKRVAGFIWPGVGARPGTPPAQREAHRDGLPDCPAVYVPA